jgi:hypothetical protein
MSDTDRATMWERKAEYAMQMAADLTNERNDAVARAERVEAQVRAVEAENAVARQLGAQWSDYVHGAHYPEASAYEDGIRRCGERLIDDMDEARDAALAAAAPSEPQETIE